MISLLCQPNPRFAWISMIQNRTMHLLILCGVALILGVSSVRGWCSAPLPSAEDHAIAHRLAMRETTSSFATDSNETSPQIDVHFHVISASAAADDGYLSVSLMHPLVSRGLMRECLSPAFRLSTTNKYSQVMALKAQMDRAESIFASYGIMLHLQSIDWTIKAEWADMGAEITMKQALRIGGYSSLNVYFVRSNRNDTRSSGYIGKSHVCCSSITSLLTRFVYCDASCLSAYF